MIKNTTTRISRAGYITYKYRVYPTKKQSQKLLWILRECKWVYSQVIALYRSEWNLNKEKLSPIAAARVAKEWRYSRYSLKVVCAQVVQNICFRVDAQFKRFVSGKQRMPRAGRAYRSFTYSRHKVKVVADGKYTWALRPCIKIPMVGNVKIKLHRPISGTVSRMTVIRYPTGKWFVCLLSKPDIDESVGSDGDGKAIGVCLTPRTVTLSNGKIIRIPQYDNMSHPKDRERIANRRSDFTHKLSRQLVRDFSTICFATLRSHDSRDQAVLDHRAIVRRTRYKAQTAQTRVALVRNCKLDRCGQCGSNMNVATGCDVCGSVISRNQSNAISVLRAGLRMLGPSR